MAIELQLPPGKTATIQLYSRSVGSDTPGGSVDAPIPGVPGSNPTVYSFDLGIYDEGDFWGQLSGVSNPNGLHFPIREGVAYIGFTWAEVDVIAPIAPTAPPALTGLCNVMVSVTFNGEPVVGGAVHCHLDEKNNTTNGYLASRAIETGVTDSSGNCILTLIQIGQFTRGGIYRLKAYDADGKLLHDRRVTIPNTSSANAEDLAEAT